MKTSGILAGAALAIAFGASAAKAEQDQVYIGGVAVVNLVTEYGFRGTAATTTYRAEFEPAYGIRGQVGYDFGEFRLEGDLGYRTMGVEEVESGTNGSGDMSITTAMANLIYDFDDGKPFMPYVGAGFGIAFFGGDTTYTNQAGITETEEFDAIAPAIQAMLGARYEVDKDVMLKAGYDVMLIAHSDDNEHNEIFVHGISVGVDFGF